MKLSSAADPFLWPRRSNAGSRSIFRHAVGSNGYCRPSHTEPAMAAMDAAMLISNPQRSCVCVNVAFRSSLHEGSHVPAAARLRGARQVWN
jgi:hypothetical protein